MKAAIAAKAKARMLSGKASDPVQNSGQGKTDKELAARADMSHGTIHKIETILKAAPETVVAKARSGELSIHAAYQATRKAKHKEERQAAKEAMPDGSESQGDLFRPTSVTR